MGHCRPSLPAGLVHVTTWCLKARACANSNTHLFISHLKAGLTFPNEKIHWFEIEQQRKIIHQWIHDYNQNYVKWGPRFGAMFLGGITVYMDKALWHYFISLFCLSIGNLKKSLQMILCLYESWSQPGLQHILLTIRILYNTFLEVGVGKQSI